MPTKLTAIVIEALDPEAQARFWAEALGWRLAETAAVHSVGSDGLRLLFVPTTRPKTHKNRLHLDLGGGPEGADRVLDLGAVRADIGQGDVPWDVLADPEGNEFCVLPEEGADGHLVALCQDAADVQVQGPFWEAATGWSTVVRRSSAVGLHALADDGRPIGPRLVMGPPVTPKAGRNRWRFAVGEQAVVGDQAVVRDRAVVARGTTGQVGSARGLATLRQDPEGNEYHVRTE
jgi:hypothetical protein